MHDEKRADANDEERGDANDEYDNPDDEHDDDDDKDAKDDDERSFSAARFCSSFLLFRARSKYTTPPPPPTAPPPLRDQKSIKSSTWREGSKEGKVVGQISHFLT
jgi:hypothetical protein